MDNSEKPPSYFKRISERLQSRFSSEPFSRAQLIDLLIKSQHRGLLDQDALDTIQRVLQVADMQVRDIMIPRPKMVVVDKDSQPEEFLTVLVESAHSRFPVIDGDKDKVVGILLAKDVLRYFEETHKYTFNMRDMLRPAVFIPESKRLNVLLTEFRANRNHMAIVVDEYGGIAGLVTIEDVLEQIVGDIEDEHDTEEDAEMILQHDENEYVVKALLPVEDFNAHFDTSFDVEENDTVGGLIIQGFGYVPKPGESVELNGFRFEILNADSRRVHLIKVNFIEPADVEETTSAT